jgi:RHH-type rel operon transcriptional repressor/antitoxin RelB
MLAVQFPDDIDQRFDALAKATGRSKDSYVQEAVVEYLADLEDFTSQSGVWTTSALAAPAR